MTINQLDKLIDLFALRIANGEQMESPEDLQFYQNYSKSIEEALRRIQIVDDARRKVLNAKKRSIDENMTKRVWGFGDRGWGSLSEQEAINLICDIRRRFEEN